MVVIVLVVGFTTTYAINAYHHERCESNLVQARCTRYNIMWVSYLQQVCGFFRVLQFPPLIKMSFTIKVFLNVTLNTITLTLHVNLNIFNLNPLCVRRLLCRGIFKGLFSIFAYAIYNRWQHIGFNFNVYIAFQELNTISPKFSTSDSELEETRMKNR
jgi:magnesium-transporting ATPase (P-type)